VPNLVALATASDCNGLTVTQSPLATSLIGLGMTSVTLTASDNAGNSVTCTVTLTVVDNTPPVITACSSNQTVVAGPGCLGTIPNLTGQVVANDPCGSVTVTQLPAPGTFGGLGTFPVDFTVTDAFGNVSMCSILLTVFSPDSDGDGTVNCLDGCPNDPLKIAPGLCGCGVPETDTDGDLVPDCIDNCDTVANAGQADVDMDGVGDACDNCVNLPNPTQADCDNDMIGDVCEIASGAPDCNMNGIPDNCDVANATSPDVNGNGIPDECETSGGVPFCFGDGTGVPCPCGNVGAPGNGCPGSSNPAGAHLAGSGISDLSADTLLLSGSGMPLGGPCLYFQGTGRVAGGAGAPFGDGKRCAGGFVARLAVVFNVGGASSYPGMGDPPVSVAGLVAAPGGRVYQIWYRDAAPFCTPDGWNLTNALDVIWVP
jgi:hypothetical protein